MLTVESNDTAFPLELTVVGANGGVSGIAPTVALRRVSSSMYLDWSDHTFKSSGWTLKYQPMNESERGHYHVSVDVHALLLSVGEKLVAEYHADDGTGTVGDTSDLIVVQEVAQATTFLRKVAANRLEEAGGNPGTLILYDDDGVSALMTWQIRDETGGPVLQSVGTPAHRSAGA